jgi:hypothetical protein
VTHGELRDALGEAQRAAIEVLRERGIEPRLTLLHVTFEGSGIGIPVPDGTELFLCACEGVTGEVLSELDDGEAIARSTAKVLGTTARSIIGPWMPRASRPPIRNSNSSSTVDGHGPPV